MTARTEMVTRSRGETEALGERLGRAARPGDVVALWGELGAGKTVIARGIARGLGIDEHEVTSPTFVILHEHLAGRLPFFHIDLYRIDPSEAEGTGWREAVEGAGVAAIEWPDRVGAELPPDRLDVRIEHAGSDERRIRFEPTGPRAAALAREAA
ncbi:MAG: tRNA (adenosine(37)-N6)-threonylcarbamoyltransferase complex ATPase subunit type 1 TsaE [Candidatus Limnocylindria bacterium]